MSISQSPRVVIVGAGFNGIVAAKTYLQINPSAQITLIDEGDCIGGVWSASRVYEGLTYEVPTPLLDFTDFDMCKELGKEMWEDVTGYEVNQFLVKYAKKHDLLRLCQLNTEVVSIERDGLRWKVFTRSVHARDASPEFLVCDKVIMAVGITSKPKIPSWDMSSFEGFRFHAKEMGKRQKELVADNVNHVTIIGGHKSALEAVGTCAQAGKKVDWIVRREGGGPAWLMPPKDPKGKPMAKMATVRITAAVSPSVYRKPNWLERFLHSGAWWLGTWLLSSFWVNMTKTIKGDKYTKSSNMKKLEPHIPNFMWIVPGGTMVHERDAETIRLIDEEKLVKINRTDVVSAQGRTVTLSNGDTIPTDAIVYCTGWEFAYPSMFSPSLSNELGLPVAYSAQSMEEKEYWQSLDSTADTRLLQRYPMLKSPPSNAHIPKQTQTPFRLFRGMVPPKLAAKGDNSLVILGNWANGRLQITAEMSSLWAVAYLEGLMPPSTKAKLANLDEMNRDIAQVDAFRRRRYLNCLQVRLSIFETPEYDDTLMRDLGLRSDRHRMRMPSGWRDLFGLKSWCAEWFESYFAKDYAGIIEEFLQGVEERKAVSGSQTLVNGY